MLTCGSLAMAELLLTGVAPDRQPEDVRSSSGRLRPEQREDLLLLHFEKPQIEALGLDLDRAVAACKGKLKHLEGTEKEKAQECVGRLSGIYEENQNILLFYLCGADGKSPTPRQDATKKAPFVPWIEYKEGYTKDPSLPAEPKFGTWWHVELWLRHCATLELSIFLEADLAQERHHISATRGNGTVCHLALALKPKSFRSLVGALPELAQSHPK